jgi:hypothetical protein
MHGRCRLLGAITIAALAWLAAGRPVDADLLVRPAGPPQAVLADSDRCAANDIPDAPARAWRGADGRVRLIAGQHRNRVWSGPSLDALARDCRIVHEGRGDPDPAALDDRTWIAAIVTRDGRDIAALAHMEFQGHRHPGRCALDRYRACWRNAIVALRSLDGGARFARASRGAVVADLPVAYSGLEGRPTGYFGPSNIVARDGFWWVWLFAEAWGPQVRGVCLLRAPAERWPPAWSAWDGRGFGARLDGSAGEAEQRVCRPLPGLGSTLASVVTHRPTGQLIAVEAARRRDAAGVERTGIWYRTATEPTHWSPPRLLIELPLLFANHCEPVVYAYPSLLDPASESRIFDSVGDRPWLYLTELASADCKPSMERRLVRLPLEIAGSR